MRKNSLLVFWGWFFCALTVQAQEFSLDELRHQFYLTTLDYQHAFTLIEKLQTIEDPTALELAYKGATQAILAKSGWNVFKKVGHLRNSRDCFKKAVEFDMKDLEIRFLRLAVEHHIPKYLGYSKNIEKDKSMIMDNIAFFSNKNLPQEIADYIIRFSLESGLYSEEEAEQVRQALE